MLLDAEATVLTPFPCAEAAAEGFLSHAKLAEGRPDLVTVRIMGWADGAPAVDYTVNAASGLPMMTGPVEVERTGTL